MPHFDTSIESEVKEFRSYFMTEWIQGKTASPCEWAFYVRIRDCTESIAVSCNNFAESGHARMKESRRKLSQSTNVYLWIEWVVSFMILEEHTRRKNNRTKSKDDYRSRKVQANTGQARAIREKHKSYPDFAAWLFKNYTVRTTDWARLSSEDQTEIMKEWSILRGWNRATEPQKKQTKGKKREDDEATRVSFEEWFLVAWNRAFVRNHRNGDCAIAGVVMCPETIFESGSELAMEECHRISREWLSDNKALWSKYFLGDDAKEIELKQSQYLLVLNINIMDVCVYSSTCHA